mmetsp:Transcript_16020/g.33125  ORF Transcript_16020/g.33125 Transcript_16020/m.33125 type:complete len:298 (-) Transcript_16020:317-1210(-)
MSCRDWCSSPWYVCVFVCSSRISRGVKLPLIVVLLLHCEDTTLFLGLLVIVQMQPQGGGPFHVTFGWWQFLVAQTGIGRFQGRIQDIGEQDGPSRVRGHGLVQIGKLGGRLGAVIQVDLHRDQASASVLGQPMIRHVIVMDFMVLAGFVFRNLPKRGVLGRISGFQSHELHHAICQSRQDGPLRGWQRGRGFHGACGTAQIFRYHLGGRGLQSVGGIAITQALGGNVSERATFVGSHKIIHHHQPGLQQLILHDTGLVNVQMIRVGSRVGVNCDIEAIGIDQLVIQTRLIVLQHMIK